MSRKHCCKLMLSCGIWINLILLPYSISETVTAEMVCENLTSAKLQYVNGTTKEEMVNVPVSCVEDLNVGCDVDVALISKSLKIYIEKDLKIFQKLRMTINTSLGEEKVLVNGLDIIESLVCLEYRNLSQMLPDDMPVSNDCFGNINQISVLLNNGTVKSHYEMTANETLRLISSAEFLMETNQTFYSILSSAINKYNNLTRSEILLPNSTVSHDDVRVLIVEMKQTIEDNLMNLTNLSDRLIGILEDRTSLIDEIHNLTYNTCHIISRTSLESGFSTVLNECFNNFKRNMRQLVMYIGERRRILRSLKVKTDNISKMIKDFRANNTCNQTKEGPSCCNSSNEWTAEMVCENLTSAKLQYVNGTTKEEMVNVPVSCVEDLNVGCDVDVALTSKSLKIYIEKDLKIFQKLRMTINTSLGEEKVLVNGLDIIESLVCLEYRNLSQMLPDDMPVSNDCFGNINQISVLLNNGTVKSHYEMTANETLRLISSAEFLMETNQTFYSILSSAINKYNNLTRSEILLPNSTVSHDDVRVLIVEMKQTIEDNLMNLTNLSDRLIGILEDRTSLIDEIHNLTYNTCHIISRTSLESGFSTVLNECFNNFKRNMRQLVMYIGERRRILRSLKVKTDNISKMIKDFRANNTCNQTKEGPSCCNSSNEWTAEMVCENLTSAKLQYVNGTTKEEMVNVPVSCVEDLNVGCDVDVALTSKSLKIYIEKDLKIFQKLRMTINTSLGEEKVLVNGLDIIESLVCLEYRNLSQMLPDDMPVSNDCFGNINQISVLLNNGTVKSHYEMTANETLRLISSAEFLMETNQTFYSILSSAINKYNNLTRSEILLPNSTVSHDDVRVLIVEMKQTIEDNLMNLTNLSDRLIGILEDRTSLIDEIHNLTYNTCHIISRTSLESGFSTVLNECFNNFKRNMRQLVMYIGERRRILRSLKVKTDNISKMIKDFRANNTCNQTKEGPSCCNSSNEWDISGFCTRLNTVIQVHNDVSTSFPLKYNTCYDDLTENKAKVMLSVLEVFLINVTEFQENLEIVCKLQKGLRNISRLENQTTMTGHIICNHVNEILAIVNFTRVSCNDTEFHLEFIQEISDSITGYVNETDNINSQLDDVLFFMQIRPNSLYKQSLKAAINDYTLLTKQTVIYRRTMWKRTAKRIVMEMKETLKQNVQSLNDTEQKLFDEYAAYVEGALILKNMTMQMCHRLNMQISHFKLHNNKLDCETDDRDLNIKLKKSLNVLRRNNIIVRMIKEAIKRLITDLKNYINDHNFENTTYSTTDESTNYVSSTIPSNFSTTMVTLNITIHSSTITSTTDSAINNITNTAITSTTDSAVNNITDTATTSTTESASNNITNSATTPTTDSEVNNITDAATTSTTESAINNITDTATTSATGSAINNITDTATTSTTESASNNITNTATSSTTESASNNITNIATTSTTDTATTSTTDSAINNITDTATTSTTESASNNITNIATTSTTDTATTSTTDSAINNITDTATTSTTESALNIMTDTTVTSATTLGTSTDTILTSAHSINPVTSTETISKTELDTSTETFDTTAFSSSINTIITTEESSPSPPSKSDNLSPLILPIVLSLSFVLFSW